MALINCPECNKEVSDKVKNCIHCGYPLQENQPSISEQENGISSTVEDSLGTVSVKEKKSPMKIIIPIIAGVLVVIIAIAVYAFTSVIPNGKYTDALALLERGKYDEANVLLNQLGSFKDAEKIREQIKYESIAYNCIDEWKRNLKNPDSFTPYEIEFYLGEKSEEGEKPSCIIHYGAQNGFGGNTTGYVLYTYSKDKEKYSLLGYTNTLKKEDLKEKDDDYAINALTIILIESYKEKGIEVGEIDMARLKVVLKNDAYSAIKIIN